MVHGIDVAIRPSLDVDWRCNTYKGKLLTYADFHGHIKSILGDRFMSTKRVESEDRLMATYYWTVSAPEDVTEVMMSDPHIITYNVQRDAYYARVGIIHTLHVDGVQQFRDWAGYAKARGIIIPT